MEDDEILFQRDEERLHHLLVGNQLALDCAAFLCICPVKKQNGKNTQL